MPQSRSAKHRAQSAPLSSLEDHTQPGSAHDTKPKAPQAGVIVDERLTVVEFLGNTGRYLQLPVGKARLNLRLMLSPGLQHPVLEAVREVREGAPRRSREGLALKRETGISRVNVDVAPLERHASGKPVIRILFQEAAPDGTRRRDAAQSRAAALSAKSDNKDVRVERLKEDLLVTRATLESLIEEQELGTARLKTAYYQLESANAELEATNEELEGVNSEMEAVNRQLQAAIREREEAEQERELLEAEVVQAQRLEGLRVMAGGVAHDFNNLLTSVIGNANLLLDALPRGTELWDAAEQIDNAGEHSAALVKQLLAFCGKAVFATEPVDLSALVTESVDLLRASISRTAELRCELAGDLPPIEADLTQMRQVLVNLVVNASEAIGGVAGVVRVSTRRLEINEGNRYRTASQQPLAPGTYVCLEVSDTGRGMDAQTKARLFEPFFSTKFPGRGLGLAAVLGIVRSHHGAIQVRSRPAQGTEIEILFPALEGAVAPPQRHRLKADWRGSGTVLVVDDEEAVRNVAKAVLQHAGLRVITAPGGREALQILRRDARHAEKVSAVLLDLVMPQMGGKQVLEALRSFDPDLPVILSSGYAEEHETAARLAACGPTSFLSKPYRPGDLLEKVREVLAGRTEISGG